MQTERLSKQSVLFIFAWVVMIILSRIPDIFSELFTGVIPTWIDSA